MENTGQSTIDGQKSADAIVEVDKSVNGCSLLEAADGRFARLCESLCLDEKTSSQSKKLFTKLFSENKQTLVSPTSSGGTISGQDAERLWSACVLFAIKRLASSPSPDDESKDDNMDESMGFTLSQILKATKLSLLEFFKELPQFVTKAGPNLKVMFGDDCEKRLMVKEVQADFYYLTVLFNYYKRLYQNLFTTADGPRGTASACSQNCGTSAVSGSSVHMRFGWMVFLVLRMRVLSRFVDLVTYINGILAVVIVLIVHIPPSLRKFNLDDETYFKERAEDGNVRIVASLCALYDDASEGDVAKMVEKLNSMVGELFRKSSTFRTRSHAEQLAGIDTEGLAYFEGLMDERSLASNLRTVEKAYEEAYQSRGELDERMFIDGEESLAGAFCSSTPTTSGMKRKCETITSPNQTASVSTGTYSPSPSSPNSSPIAKSASAITSARMPPPTPVSVTMSTVKWLRTIISPLPADPASDLQHFCRSCDYDISDELVNRAMVVLKEIFSSNGAQKYRDSRGTDLLDSSWVEERRLEAMKLYYRVLGAMCKAEAQRLGNENLTALLKNDKFHRCMIALAAELVFYTHKTATMAFPAVLEATGISAFDLSKVIESFVRHEETLPRELKRHLNSMEQQILESMAWEKGSSMYNSLIVAKRHLAPAINSWGLLADPMPALLSSAGAKVDSEGPGTRLSLSPRRGMAPSNININSTPIQANGVGESGGNLLSPVKDRPSAFSAFTSPGKNRPQPPLQSVFASPQRPSPLGGGETCAETVINVFFIKVLKLAAVRVKDLCERLHQPNHVLEHVYQTFKHILYKETVLFFDRHIDQILLCSIYGVCKVIKANVTFKTCIEHYGRQPQCKRQVFCNVLIDIPSMKYEGKGRTQERGDIIKFYNQIFVPATKQFLVQIGENAAAPAASGSRPEEERKEKDGAGPGSPKPSSFPSVPDMSPKKVSPSHNVYVSPLRATKRESIMSPHTRSLFACVGESTQAYQSPSKDLTAISNRVNNRCHGRLDFNGVAVGSDSMVPGSFYPWTRTAAANSARLTSDSILSGPSQPSWTTVAGLPPSPLKRPRTDM